MKEKATSATPAELSATGDVVAADTCDILATAARAKVAASSLPRLTAQQRKQALLNAVEELLAAQNEIEEANKADLAKAQEQLEQGKMTQALFARLKLDQGKLRSVTDGMLSIAQQPDPLGAVTLATELDEGLELYRIVCPIGLIAVIFESRPDALPQIASLCLKSGNAVILKGGREALATNRILFQCIVRGAARAGVPEDALVLLETREAIDKLLKADAHVDLIVPRGSNELVRYIQDNTRIPVLGHADGLCHLYIDQAADEQMAIKLAVDAKTQYPAACNAVETILIHHALAPSLVPQLASALSQAGVEIRADSESLLLLRGRNYDVRPAKESDWSTEYCDQIVSLKVVPSLESAVEHINKYGSHHTDAIVTNDQNKFDQFFASVDSAGVYWNASTRFADGFRYGFGAEVGISTGKLHPRGPVGLEGLTTYKYKLLGKGHIVDDYAGENARQFKHKPIE